MEAKKELMQATLHRNCTGDSVDARAWWFVPSRLLAAAVVVI
jgi:hypothetical protein